MNFIYIDLISMNTMIDLVAKMRELNNKLKEY